MKLKRPRRLNYGESSSASDVAFLLIIYFIVIAGFNVNKGFLINLPAKDSTRLILKEDLIRFELDKDGYITYDTQLIGLPEAERLIKSALVFNPNIAVLLSIDPQARWQRVVSFVELAQDLKIESFSFTMMKETL